MKNFVLDDRRVGAISHVSERFVVARRGHQWRNITECSVTANHVTLAPWAQGQESPALVPPLCKRYYDAPVLTTDQWANRRVAARARR